jgi:DNA-binding transcriptional MocR family regulator
MLSEPQGGFVLWVQMPPQVDALALHGKAIAGGVAFMPGQLFSASGVRQLSAPQLRQCVDAAHRAAVGPRLVKDAL